MLHCADKRKRILELSLQNPLFLLTVAVYVLPYHAYGASKYTAIGKVYEFPAHTPDEQEMQLACERLSNYDLQVKI